MLLWWRGFKALLSQCVPFSLADAGRVSSASETSSGQDFRDARMTTREENTFNSINQMHERLLSNKKR
eukprot:1145039-Pelagomonas_calceolata.AAC.4